tara:strand:+ start:61 stop:309 length:249 start_codon:yes stop_codon:yes gene_type:complete
MEMTRPEASHGQARLADRRDQAPPVVSNGRGGLAGRDAGGGGHGRKKSRLQRCRKYVSAWGATFIGHQKGNRYEQISTEHTG